MSFKLRFAADALASGGIVAYPTEAVWGLGCDPDNPHAVTRLLQLKQRDWRKGMILVAASEDQFEPYLHNLNSAQRQRLRSRWPGPITWLVPHDGNVPEGICGEHPVIALRVSAHPVVKALCEQYAGPIVSTSANPSGRKPARDFLTVRRYFGDAIDAYVRGALGGARQPSEIRDLLSDAVIREG